MKAEKKNTETEALARQNQLPLRCGDCLHYKGSPHPMYGASCVTLGVKTYAAAPSCYTPNVMLFRKIDSNTFAMLGSILATFTPQQTRIFMGLLKSIGALEKHGFTFLQKVYFRAGGDFLDNYFSGRILGVGVNGTIAVVGENYFSTVKSPLIAYLFPDSIIPADKFKKKRAALERKGLLYAPRRPHRNVIEGDYEPPTMETAPEVLEKLANTTFAKKSKPKRAPMGDSLEVDLGLEAKKPAAKKAKPAKKVEEDEDEEDFDE